MVKPWLDEKLYDLVGRVIFPLACRVTGLVLFVLEVRDSKPSEAVMVACIGLLGLPWVVPIRRRPDGKGD